MIIEKSKELLEKLRRTNYKRIPDFGMDEESEMIIKVIINECKSTLAFQDQDGEVTFERYGSDIIKENIEQIVRQIDFKWWKYSKRNNEKYNVFK